MAARFHPVQKRRTGDYKWQKKVKVEPEQEVGKKFHGDFQKKSYFEMNAFEM